MAKILITILPYIPLIIFLVLNSEFFQTQVVYVDFEAEDPASTFECRDDQSTCPGGAILGTGCAMPNCDTFALNPYGLSLIHI